MKVGFIGLGKLGLPLAVAAAYRGHDVVGFDVDPEARKYRKYPHKELGPEGLDDFQSVFAGVTMSCAGACPRLTFADTIADLVSKVELIFVVVQTPHGPQYEGVTRLPDTRSDFDYTYLVRAVKEIAEHVQLHQTVAVVSTVLPGTMRREVIPLLSGRCAFAYNPAFPAMGTALQDYLKPEFVLVGYDGDLQPPHMADYYATLIDYSASVLSMSVESAELAKVAYNCTISSRIAMVNAFMEVCHKVPGCDVSDVSDVLKHATKRIVAPAYMDGGVGDGGGCHPRDNIAMSYLSRELCLSYDPFTQAMIAREHQSEWLAELALAEAKKHSLPIVLLGKAYKPETNITTGSAAFLVAELLRERKADFFHWDPHVDPGTPPFMLSRPYCFLLLTKHRFFQTFPFPSGSVVVDPFRMVPLRHKDIEVVSVGVGK
jgi:UDPglucose 6-dehydrogenase